MHAGPVDPPEPGTVGRMRARPSTRRPLAVVACLFVLCVAGVLALTLFVELFASSSAAGDVEALLFNADRLLVDGDAGAAADAYSDALREAPGHFEARIRLEFCDHAQLGSRTEHLQTKVAALLSDDVPLPFRELVTAELLVLEGNLDAAHPHFEVALAEGGERLRYAVQHRVDHIGAWAATELFCLSVRLPRIEDRILLRRFVFRPYAPLHLTLFICIPSGGLSLVYPREGAGAETPVAKGAATPVAANECLVVEFTEDAEEWVPLLNGSGMFLCGIATSDPPDRERLARSLADALRKLPAEATSALPAAGSGTVSSAAAVCTTLREALGVHSVVTIDPPH